MTEETKVMGGATPALQEVLYGCIADEPDGVTCSMLCTALEIEQITAAAGLRELARQNLIRAARLPRFGDATVWMVAP